MYMYTEDTLSILLVMWIKKFFLAHSANKE